MSAQQRENAMVIDSESGDDTRIYYIGSYVNLHLPVNAPKGHPHIIDTTSLRSPPDGNLLAVDAIATVLYKWNAMALSDLLRGENRFYWSYKNGDGDEFYVDRNYIDRSGTDVHIGFTARVFSPERPDFKVTYRIDHKKCWKITGGGQGPHFDHHLFDLNTKDGREEAEHFDNRFAKYLIVNECWKKSSKKDVLCYDLDGEEVYLGDSDNGLDDESNEKEDEDANAEVRLP